MIIEYFKILKDRIQREHFHFLNNENVNKNVKHKF